MLGSRPIFKNSIGFLRFAFAFAVLISHEFSLGGFGAEPLSVYSGGRETLGSMSVASFLFLSGFVVVAAYARRPRLLPFLFNRALRILPGLYVCLLFVAFVVGPLHAWLNQMPLSDYFHAPDGPLAYLVSNAAVKVGSYGIAGLPKAIPYAGPFNGSLWSLIYEIYCYGWLAALGVAGGLSRRWGTVVIALILAVAAFIQAGLAPALLVEWVARVADPLMVKLSAYFAAGALCYLLRDYLPLDWRAALVAALGLGVSLAYAALFPLTVVCLAYLVIWLAFTLPLRHFDARGDFSYGVYLYAFPVQQTVAATLGKAGAGYLTSTAVSALFTLALAFASWHLVEKRALRAKNLFSPRVT